MGDFHNIFKNLRMQNHYTQGQMADLLGISRSAVSMYETGNREPDLETLEKIAKFFNVDMNYLLGSSVTVTSDNPEPSYEDIEHEKGCVFRIGLYRPSYGSRCCRHTHRDSRCISPYLLPRRCLLR